MHPFVFQIHRILVLPPGLFEIILHAFWRPVVFWEMLENKITFLSFLLLLTVFSLILFTLWISRKFAFDYLLFGWYGKKIVIFFAQGSISTVNVSSIGQLFFSMLSSFSCCFNNLIIWGNILVWTLFWAYINTIIILKVFLSISSISLFFFITIFLNKLQYILEGLISRYSFSFWHVSVNGNENYQNQIEKWITGYWVRQMLE